MRTFLFPARNRGHLHPAHRAPSSPWPGVQRRVVAHPRPDWRLPQNLFRLFPTVKSWVPEPVRRRCITSCLLCITFAGNLQVTRADLLKMNRPADSRKMKKRRHRPAFSTAPQALPRLAAPPADRDLVDTGDLKASCPGPSSARTEEAQALFRQTSWQPLAITRRFSK
jgi:hypothetical protein